MWTIAITPFGTPMYPTTDALGGWTDRLDEATRFDHRDDKGTKLKWFKAVAAGLFGKVDAEVVELKA